MSPISQPSGMRAFTIVWIGQVVSLLGSAMTRFALTIWAWQITGQATALALMAFFSFAPVVLLSPVAGALVDRWNRKLVVMLSDLAAGLATVAVLLLYTSGQLQIWHLYAAALFAGAFETFQFPAYSAAMSVMLRKEQYARANGMMALAQSASEIFGPLAAGAALGVVGITGIMTFDVLTFVVAILAVLAVSIPQPAVTAAGRAGRGSLRQESVYGFRYILARPSLLGLQLAFFMMNLLGTFGFTVLSAMILARTGNDELALSGVNAAAGIGGVIGGLLLSVWGGPKRRVHGVLLGMALSSMGTVLLGLGRALPLWAAGAFATAFFIPILNGCNQAIWQAKVPPDVQGRVFATRRMIAQITVPVAMLIAGPLADYVFEPGLLPGGALVGVFGGLVGTGAGAGMSLMLLLSGALGVFAGLGGYAFRAVRNAEDILPDHGVEAAPEADTDAAASAEAAPAR